MTSSNSWTLFDETVLLYARTMEHELRNTHGVLFAAAFLDEFEGEIRKVAFNSLIAHWPTLPRFP